MIRPTAMITDIPVPTRAGRFSPSGNYERQRSLTVGYLLKCNLVKGSTLKTAYHFEVCNFSPQCVKTGILLHTKPSVFQLKRPDIQCSKMKRPLLFPETCEAHNYSVAQTSAGAADCLRRAGD